LNICTAQPCWPSIEASVLREWRRRVRIGEDPAPDALKERLVAATLDRPTDSSPSWVPIHHPLEEFPELFSAPVAIFSAVARPDALEGSAHLAFLAQTAGSAGPQQAVESAQVVRQLLGAFSNLAEAAGDPSIRLRGFSFSRYLEALGQIPSEDRESLWTPRQERLTQTHHDWCCERFEDRLSRVTAPGRNPHRLAMAREVILAAGAVARDLEGSSPQFLLPPDRLSAIRAVFGSDEGPASVLSIWARESRMGDVQRTISAFQERTPWSISRVEILQTLGFFIRLAPELFGFYLLLWEIAALGERSGE